MTEEVVTEKEGTAQVEKEKKPKLVNGEGVIPALRQCASYEQFKTWITDLGRALFIIEDSVILEMKLILKLKLIFGLIQLGL